MAVKNQRVIAQNTANNFPTAEAWGNIFLTSANGEEVQLEKGIALFHKGGKVMRGLLSAFAENPEREYTVVMRIRAATNGEDEVAF